MTSKKQEHSSLRFEVSLSWILFEVTPSSAGQVLVASMRRYNVVMGYNQFELYSLTVRIDAGNGTQYRWLERYYGTMLEIINERCRRSPSTSIRSKDIFYVNVNVR